MSDEMDPRKLITEEVFRDIVSVLKSVYGGGYVNQKLTFEERKELRAKSYRTLKALGLEK
jgi:hypothetical protein